MGKRGRDDSDDGPPRRHARGEEDGGGGGGAREEKSIGQMTSHIKNKQRRSEVYDKLRHKAAVAKKKARVKRQAEVANAYEQGVLPPPRAVPKTIDNTREADPTIVQPDDEEALAGVAEDEFAAHFARDVEPSLLVTTSRKPSGRIFEFLSNLFETLPNATYYARKAYPVSQICKFANARGFTNLLIFNEVSKFGKGARVDGLLLIHLPEGPSAHFRLSNLTLTKDIAGHGRATSHTPELILNNFTTALGHRVGRMFASLLPQEPQFRGRRVVTLHNQRDYIFFRHHRYVFEQREGGRVKQEHTGHLAPAIAPPPPGVKGRKKKKGGGGAAAAGTVEDGNTPVTARLQELGPRFTLKLQSLQKGLFDPKQGEFEWLRPPPGDAAGASRRKFAL